MTNDLGLSMRVAEIVKRLAVLESATCSLLPKTTPPRKGSVIFIDGRECVVTHCTVEPPSDHSFETWAITAEVMKGGM